MPVPTQSDVDFLLSHSMLAQAQDIGTTLCWARRVVATAVCRCASTRGRGAGVGLVHRLPSLHHYM